MPHSSGGSFGVFLDSKITGRAEFEIYSDNLDSLFSHLGNPELVGSIYFVDDSTSEFQPFLLAKIKALAGMAIPSARVVEITGNKSIYHAVNRAWEQVKEDYVIRLHSDFRLVQTLPLDTICRAFEKYPDVYLIYMRVRALFGYNDATKEGLRKSYPWYAGYPEDVMETWYTRDENGRIYSAPERLFSAQKAGKLGEEYRGTELFARPIDDHNTLWTPGLPAALLLAYPTHESFAGGGGIARVSALRQVLPLPRRYLRRPPADCFETYFWETPLDSRYYSGYLNLQAFTVCFQDPKRPLQDYERGKWDAFLERNGRPVTANGKFGRIWSAQKAARGRLFHACLLTGWRRRIGWRLKRTYGEILAFGSRVKRRLAGIFA